MTFFCIPFIVLYLLSHVKIVVCICMYSILNKILFTLIKVDLGYRLDRLYDIRLLCIHSLKLPRDREIELRFDT